MRHRSVPCVSPGERTSDVKQSIVDGHPSRGGVGKEQSFRRLILGENVEG